MKRRGVEKAPLSFGWYGNVMHLPLASLQAAYQRYGTFVESSRYGEDK